MSAGMVVVNGAALAFDEEATIRTLLDRMGRSGDGVAAAVNGEIVVRSDWASRRLRDGDRIELLTAVQGG